MDQQHSNSSFSSWESWPPPVTGGGGPPSAAFGPSVQNARIKRSHGDVDDGGAVAGPGPGGGSFDEAAERSFKRLRIEGGGPPKPPTTALPGAGGAVVGAAMGGPLVGNTAASYGGAAPQQPWPRQPATIVPQHAPRPQYPHQQPQTTNSSHHPAPPASAAAATAQRRTLSPYYQAPGQETSDHGHRGGRFVPIDSSSQCSTDVDDVATCSSETASHGGYRGDPLCYPSAGGAVIQQDYSNVNRLLGELHAQRHGRRRDYGTVQQQQYQQQQYQQQQQQQQYLQQQQQQHQYPGAGGAGGAPVQPPGPAGMHQRRNTLSPNWEMSSSAAADGSGPAPAGQVAQGSEGFAGAMMQQQMQQQALYGRPAHPQQHPQQQQRQQHVPSWKRSVRLPSDTSLY